MTQKPRNEGSTTQPAAVGGEPGADRVGALGSVHRDLLETADFAFARLRARLRGLTDAEYLWEPAPGCWSVRPAGDGTFRADGSGMPRKPAPLTTIAWRVSHLSDVLGGERNATWLGVTPVGTLDGDPAGTPPGPAGTALAALRRLERAYDLFRAHVAAADPGGLTTPMGPIAGPYADSTRAAFILHELDELIHHASETAAMRDVYRATRPAEPIVAAAVQADRVAVEAALADDPGAPERHPELLARLAAEGNWAAVRLLVDLGFDVNASAGISALHYAAGAGELAMVTFLVERGADPAVPDTEFEATPAGWARHFGHADVVAYLG